MIGVVDVLGTLLAFVGIWIYTLDRRKGFGPMLVALALLLTSGAFAQDGGHHPPEHQALHNQFYRTWMMPSNRSVSCCHDEDCAPAEVRFKDGQWLARKVGEVGPDGQPVEFTPVPPEKVEHDRDSPDGRNHLCGRRYSFNAGLTVMCFLPAPGI